jgi:flagellar hook-associated protein 3 FlgL
MRVTERLIFDRASRNTASAREAAQQAQDAASTGLRVNHPGDDPAASGLITQFRMSSDRLAAISGGAAAASDELAAADGALDTVATALSRARQLAVQFANAGYSQQQAAGGAEEVEALFKQIVSSLNTQYGNRYIFGGSSDDAPPFLASGEYVGDDRARQLEIAPGVLEQSNVLVGAMGTDPTDPTAGTTLNVLESLRVALTNNDTAAIAAALDGLDDGIEFVSLARSQAGASMHAFDTAVSVAKTMADNDTVRAGALSDVDFIESAVRLQATQTALQASLSVTAQSFKLSLLNYL